MLWFCRLLLSFSASLVTIYAKAESSSVPAFTTAPLDTTVSAIVQDSSGYLWFGTQQDLYRFDGRELKKIEPGEETYPHHFIYKLSAESDGSVWISTLSGVALYDPLTQLFRTIEFPAESPRVYDVLKRKNGSTVFATEYGLYELMGGRAFRMDSGPKNPRALLEDSLGRMWVGTEGDGVFLENQSGFTQLENLDEIYVREMIFDSENYLWIATFSHGVWKIDSSTLEQQNFGVEVLGSRNRARALLEDSEGQIWIGSDAGVHIWSYQTEKMETYGTGAGLRPGIVYDLFEDAGGVVWVAAFSGASKYVPGISRFSAYTLTGLRSDDVVSSFIENLDGEVVIGTHSGLAKWDYEVGEISDFGLKDGLPLETYVTSLEADQNGTIWVGTYSDGVLGIKNGEVVKTIEGLDQQFSLHGVTDLLIDDAALWISTFGAGLAKYDLESGALDFYPAEDDIEGKFPDLKCIELAKDTSGNIWVATRNEGAFLFDPDTHVVKSIKTNLAADYAANLSIAAGGVYFGSFEGEVYFLDMQTQDLDVVQPLLGEDLDGVYGMLFTGQELWLSSASHLYLFDPSKALVKKFSRRHGIVTGEFNHGAEYRLSSGNLLFGGARGFLFIDPSRVTDYSFKPSLNLVSLKIDHEERLVSPDVELEHGVSSLMLEVAAMDFAFPESIEYRYVLEGFDPDWIDIGNSGAITYTNLDPGSYVLRVKATNSDGVWSENELALPITIAPPWWGTWWAYTLYVVLALGLFYQLLQLSARRVSLQAEGRFNQRLRHYVSALDDAAECVLNATDSGRVLYVNDAVRHVLGKSVSSAIGHSLFDVLFDDDAAKERARQALEADGQYLDEIALVDRGEQKVLEVSIRKGEQRVDDDVTFVCVVRDITLRREKTDDLKAQLSKLETELEHVSSQLHEKINETETFRVAAQTRIDTDERLLQSFHDRINDNLQMLSSLFSIQAAKATDENVIRVLDDNQQRIKAVALIHEHLLQTEELSQVEMADYVDVLVTSLYRRLAPSYLHLDLTKDISNVKLSLDQAVPAGLLLNELVSNAYVHAFKHKTHGSGHVRVSFYELAGECVVLVSDDGVGLPADIHLESHAGVGFEIVSTLSSQLGGSFKLVGGIGTTFEVRFPIERA